MPLPADQARILVVDDEPAIRTALSTVLDAAGYAVHTVESGEAALEYLDDHDIDLALLDIRMSGMSGVDLMRKVKERCPHIAVILLTGYASLESAIAAVRAGADDYLMKPSGAEIIKTSVTRALDRHLRERRRDELLNQLRETLSQVEDSLGPPGRDQTSVLRVADLTVDPLRHEAQRGTESLDLTPTEFALLTYLMRNAERVIGHQELVREVQGYETEVWEARELIKYHIHTLRQKLEPDPSHPQYIHTVRGLGYKLSAPER
ncbi:MAG: response regulator transcription factor [Anaerolineae bacterium]